MVYLFPLCVFLTEPRLFVRVTCMSSVQIVRNHKLMCIAQVDRIPLAALFGAQGSLNDFRGAVLGRRNKHCSYGDVPLKLPRKCQTGGEFNGLYQEDQCI